MTNDIVKKMVNKEMTILNNCKINMGLYVPVVDIQEK